MEIRKGYIKAKREVFLKEINGNYIVELLRGKDMYSFIKRNIRDCNVDCKASILFSPDVLLSDSCKDKFFYIHPEKDKVVSIYENYDDTWFTLNTGKIRKKTYVLVDKCLDILYDSGFSKNNLIYFIKKYDGFYHLVVDGKEYGYLDNSTSDIEFKNMLSSAFKDIGHTVDVIVMPSIGVNFIFTNTLGLYNKLEDFDIACKSKGVLSVTEKGIEEFIPVY